MQGIRGKEACGGKLHAVCLQIVMPLENEKGSFRKGGHRRHDKRCGNHPGASGKMCASASQHRPRVLSGWKAALPVYVIVLALYLNLFMVIPSAGSSDASLRALKESAPEMDKIGAFFRRLQGYVLNLIENIRSLTFEKVIGILKDLSKNTIDILRAVPSHIGNFISNFSQIARKQWALLKETLRQLWPPRLAWERLKEFAALHKQQIQKLTEGKQDFLANNHSGFILSGI